MSERDVFVESSVAREEEATEAAQPAPSGLRKHRQGARGRSEAMRKVTKDALEFGALIYPPRINAEFPRPKRYSECEALHLGLADNPCPYVSCKYHLAIEVDPYNGSIRTVRPDVDIDQLPDTCALRVAERGGETLEDLGEIMNISRERVRQLEENALRKLRARTEAAAMETPVERIDPTAHWDPPGHIGIDRDHGGGRGGSKILGRW